MNELLVPEKKIKNGYELIEKDLLKDAQVEKKQGDTLIDRSFIRHDPDKVAAAILGILDKI